MRDGRPGGADRARRRDAAAATAAGARPRRSRLGGLAGATASSPSAPSSVGFGASVAGVDGGDDRQAGTQRPSFSTSSGKVMRTATRCTTLVKLPVALSGGSSENCAPEAGEIDDTTPSTSGRRARRPTTSTFWPGWMSASCVSLKLAST